MFGQDGRRRNAHEFSAVVLGVQEFSSAVMFIQGGSGPSRYLPFVQSSIRELRNYVVSVTVTFDIYTSSMS